MYIGHFEFFMNNGYYSRLLMEVKSQDPFKIVEEIIDRTAKMASRCFAVDIQKWVDINRFPEEEKFCRMVESSTITISKPENLEEKDFRLPVKVIVGGETELSHTIIVHIGNIHITINDDMSVNAIYESPEGEYSSEFDAIIRNRLFRDYREGLLARNTKTHQTAKLSKNPIYFNLKSHKESEKRTIASDRSWLIDCLNKKYAEWVKVEKPTRYASEEYLKVGGFTAHTVGAHDFVRWLLANDEQIKKDMAGIKLGNDVVELYTTSMDSAYSHCIDGQLVGLKNCEDCYNWFGALVGNFCKLTTYIIFYADEKHQLRAYIPTLGNVYNSELGVQLPNYYAQKAELDSHSEFIKKSCEESKTQYDPDWVYLVAPNVKYIKDDILKTFQIVSVEPIKENN